MIDLKREKLILAPLLLSVGLLYGCEQQEDERQSGGVPQSTAVEPAAMDSDDSGDGASDTDVVVAAVATGVDGGESQVERAKARLEARSGSDVTGSVSFTALADDEGVEVILTAQGLTEGEHGFHIHETGDCSAADASSAGGHFNPEGTEHGAPDSDTHHVGDMGNITVGADGQVNAEMTFDHLSLTGTNAIVGKAVIIHEMADDLESQPSGDAGDRVACGVIRAQP